MPRDSIRVVYNHLDNVARQLAFLADEMVKNEAEIMRSTAENMVPVRTGLLRSTIKSVKTGLASYEVEANTKYAGYVEWGTRYMNAQPYMTPGYAAGLLALPVEARKFGVNIKRVARGGR